jgi:hypothetical protein
MDDRKMVERKMVEKKMKTNIFLSPIFFSSMKQFKLVGSEGQPTKH